MTSFAAVVFVVATLVTAFLPDDAHGRGGGRHGGGQHGHRHHHHGVRSGVVFWGPSLWLAPYWWYYPPPPLVVEEPPTYIEQPSYWYYCPSAGAYYRNVPSCAETWIKVPPRSQ